MLAGRGGSVGGATDDPKFVVVAGGVGSGVLGRESGTIGGAGSGCGRVTASTVVGVATALVASTFKSGRLLTLSLALETLDAG
jgi:hypothetical protein